MRAFFKIIFILVSVSAGADEAAQRMAEQVCARPAPVLIVDTFEGDPTNFHNIDLNGDGEFETHHGDLTEKLVQLNGQTTVRLNVSTPVFTPQLLHRLSERLVQVQNGEQPLSWINFSQGYSISFHDLDRFIDRKVFGRVTAQNVADLAPLILKGIDTRYPNLQIAALVQLFEAFGRLGIPIVVAAGNSGFNEINLYSLFPNVITVGALSLGGKPTQYSSDHSLISLWRAGDIRSFATPDGIDLNGDHKIDFPLKTHLLQETDLQSVNGRLGYEVKSEVPSYLQIAVNPNEETFNDLISKLPAGLYDTRKTLKMALGTPQMQVQYLCNLGDYFYMDGRNKLPALFFRTNASDLINLDPELMKADYQLRVIIRGTSFAAPNLCSSTAH